ncbi:Lactose transport system permease protein LacF [compost metagenome]
MGQVTGLSFFNLPWLGTGATSFWAIVIVFVWQNAGYLMVIYISAINNVPQSLIEASKVDGAGRMQSLRHVTIPLVMPAVTVCLFLSISWSFKLFDLNLSLTKGGPFKATESVALNIYNEAYTISRFGMGSAKAMIFFVIVAVISLLQVRATKKREVEL